MLVQFKAHLRKHGAHVVLERPRPSDLNTQRNSIPMNVQQRRIFNDEPAEYDRFGNIASRSLLRRVNSNPRRKHLGNREFYTALKLLQRLRQRDYTVDDITEAAHVLQSHALKHVESESGAVFWDTEMRDYVTWA